MKNKGVKLTIWLLIIVFMVTIFATGCAKKEVTLESYVKDNPSEQQAIEDLMSTDENAKLEFQGNTMRIIYTVTAEALEGMGDSPKSIFEEAFALMEDTFKGVVQELERITEIDGIEIEIIYNDEAGNEIARKAYGKE